MRFIAFELIDVTEPLMPKRNVRGLYCRPKANLRETQDSLDDTVSARLDIVGAVLDAFPNVLGLALDCAPITPQRGRATSLESVELLAAEPTVAVGAKGRGYAVSRLERSANRDQQGTLSLTADRSEASALGRGASSDASGRLLGGRAHSAGSALGGGCCAASGCLGGTAALFCGVSLTRGGGLLGGRLTLGSGLRSHMFGFPSLA
jgi:hypothetical protein